MKKLQFILIVLVAFLATNFSANAQNAGITTCGNYYGCPGTYITISVAWTYSTSCPTTLKGMGLQLDYDGTVLSFVRNPTPPNLNNIDAGLLNGGSGCDADAFNTGTSSAYISMWAGNSYNITVPNGIMFKLRFYFYGGTTTLSWNNTNNSGQYCQYYDVNGNAVYDNNGSTLPFYINSAVSDICVVSGQFLYDNTNNPTALDLLQLTLKDAPTGSVYGTTQTDTYGNYTFTLSPTYCLEDGYDYCIYAGTGKPTGGINTTDAVLVQNTYTYPYTPLANCLRSMAGDVNNSGYIDTTDKRLILWYYSGKISSFTAGDWEFRDPNFLCSYCIMHTSANSADVANFRGVCYGDVNGSYIPPTGAKSSSSSKINFNYTETINLKENEYYEMPIKISGNINNVAAISLILKYPQDLVKINDIKFINNGVEEDLVYNVNKTDLRIGWLESNQFSSVNFNNNNEIIVIKFTTTSKFGDGDIINFTVVNDPLCELANSDGTPIEDVLLNIPSIEYGESKGNSDKSNENINNIVNYYNYLDVNPNPAKDVLNINYTLANNGNINIALYNSLGEKVFDIVNNNQFKGKYDTKVDLSNIPIGVYTCKMTLGDDKTIIKRFVITK